MFLDIIARRNPELIRAAVALHREGQIPPGDVITLADSAGQIVDDRARRAR